MYSRNKIRLIFSGYPDSLYIGIISPYILDITNNKGGLIVFFKSQIPSRRINDIKIPSNMQHFTETHRKTSNFDISTCHFCFMQKIIYYSKRNSPRFSLPKFCRCSIYVITIVNFTNRAVQSLFNFPQRSSMDFSKVTNYTF